MMDGDLVYYHVTDNNVRKLYTSMWSLSSNNSSHSMHGHRVSIILEIIDISHITIVLLCQHTVVYNNNSLLFSVILFTVYTGHFVSIRHSPLLSEIP